MQKLVGRLLGGDAPIAFVDDCWGREVELSILPAGLGGQAETGSIVKWIVEEYVLSSAGFGRIKWYAG